MSFITTWADQGVRIWAPSSTHCRHLRAAIWYLDSLFSAIARGLYEFRKA
ncbi:hypothetical protein FOCG_17715 [Fusarium oxysporum f. sp. radicis-lycopersici 26381]|nr:hypothetical protein FOCG_17715 [Fusarium oxysporum f. sp. radicis-lycopersici 26381]